MTENDILAQVKRLPPLPLVAHRLTSLMQQDQCSAADVTTVLTSDQMLTGNILKLANSSFYGLSGQVTSVSRAVVILGFSAIRSMALGLGLAQTINKAAEARNLESYWGHALYVAAAARTLARESNYRDPEEAFIAGLLHDLGRLLIEMSYPELMQDLVGVPADRLLATETELTGMAHTKVGQQIVRHWNLPESLGRVLRFHHHPTQWRNNDLTAIVVLACLMARALGHSEDPAPTDLDPLRVAAQIGVSLAETEDLLARTFQEVEHTRAFLDVAGVDLSAAALEPPTREELSTTVVYIGTDAQRRGWLLGQFAIRGWQTLSMRDFLANPDLHADLAVLDPDSISGEQAGKLAAALRSREIRIATTRADDGLAALFPGARPLPIALSADDLLLDRFGMPNQP